jgi:hypothetical protein
MSSNSAQIFVGMTHPNSGGIILDKTIWLSENGRPALILKEGEGEERVWIPTLENTIEDALLMISNCIVKAEEALRALKEINDITSEKHVEIYEAFTEEQREKLYLANRKALGKYNDLKIVVTVLEGSLFRSQLPILEQYDIDMEVCLSIYSRTYSEWQEKVVINGSLEINNIG